MCLATKAELAHADSFEIWGMMMPRTGRTVMTICPLFATTTPHVANTVFDDIYDLNPAYILFLELCRLKSTIHGTATTLKPL